jgi:hypothetical protein
VIFLVFLRIPRIFRIFKDFSKIFIVGFPHPDFSMKFFWETLKISPIFKIGLRKRYIIKLRTWLDIFAWIRSKIINYKFKFFSDSWMNYDWIFKYTYFLTIHFKPYIAFCIFEYSRTYKIIRKKMVSVMKAKISKIVEIQKKISLDFSNF